MLSGDGITLWWSWLYFPFLHQQQDAVFVYAQSPPKYLHILNVNTRGIWGEQIAVQNEIKDYHTKFLPFSGVKPFRDGLASLTFGCCSIPASILLLDLCTVMNYITSVNVKIIWSPKSIVKNSLCTTWFTYPVEFPSELFVNDLCRKPKLAWERTEVKSFPVIVHAQQEQNKSRSENYHKVRHWAFHLIGTEIQVFIYNHTTPPIYIIIIIIITHGNECLRRRPLKLHTRENTRCLIALDLQLPLCCRHPRRRRRRN